MSFLIVSLSIAIALGVRMAMDPILQDRQPFAPFYAAVAVVAWFAGRGPSIITIVLGYLVADYFFLPPRYQFALPEVSDLVESSLYFPVSVLLVLLIHTMRRAERRANEEASAARVARAQAEEAHTARMDAERQARSTAEAANRAKDDFLAMLAHELRNPLAPVRNAVALLRLLAPEDPKIDQVRDIIDRQVSHMVRLVDDLLDVSRITRGKMTLQKKRVCLRDIVAQAVETARPLIEQKAHDLRIAIATETIWLEADDVRLVQSVGNLLTNAAKFTPPGGIITITVEPQDGEVVMSIRDTGVGIAAEAVEHLFEPFVQEDPTLDRQHAGLGLGLTVAKRLIEMHGGRLTARSDGKGLGSEFTITLPRIPAAVPVPSPEPKARATASAPLQVLIVEDNPDTADSLMMYLQLLGHRVRVAHDGPTALQLVEDATLDVALVDIGLPGMNGYEVASRMRELPAMRQAVLVALTGYGRDENRQRALAAGFDCYLVKPVDPAAVQAVLARQLEQRGREGSIPSDHASL